MSAETYYFVLGISETATQDDIERRYREFIAAYRVLWDPAQRSSYDQQLAQRPQQTPFATPVPPNAAVTSPRPSLLLPPERWNMDKGNYCFPPQGYFNAKPAASATTR